VGTSRFRKPTALFAVAGAAVAVFGLTGCDSKVGTAAVVGSHRVSDSDVQQYLTVDAKPFSVQSQSGTPQTIVPRSYVLTALIREELFSKALAKTSGGVPADSVVTAAEQQLTQGATKAQQEKQYTQYGFKGSFAALDLRDSALEGLLAQRVGATNDAGPIFKAIEDLHLPVSVSGRYGSWDESSLGLKTDPADGAPSFVQLNVASYGNEVPAVPGS
jgi:hypothetical protein